MAPGFKELLRMDNEAVFLNPDEFGEEHIISGRKMMIIIDDNEMIEREKRQTSGRDYRQGIFNKQLLFYVSAKMFGSLPAVGRSLVLDNRTYTVTDAINEMGIYSISLEAVKS